MYIFKPGLTGCLAAIMMPQSIVIQQDSITPHKAILRFRSDTVSDITDIPFRKVNVTKNIYVHGAGFISPSPKASNLYSMKVTGGYHNRSINNLKDEVRWLAPDDFHEQLLGKIGGRIISGDYCDYLKCRQEPLISTIPINEISDLIGATKLMEIDGVSNPIYVTTSLLDCESTVNQTIYYPNPETSVYRATIEGKKVIIESILPISNNDASMVFDSFGVDNVTVIDLNFVQNLGKITPIDERSRHEWIYHLTDKYNIYSLGRVATWRPSVLLGDVIKDVYKIKDMMRKTNYQRLKG